MKLYKYYLETWSCHLNKKDLSFHIDNLIKELKNKEKVIFVHKHFSHLIERDNLLFASFEGYTINLITNLEPFKIKQICTNYEFEPLGERIADIDIYHKNKKISRKK